MIHISKADKRRKVSRGPFTSRFLPLGTTLENSADHGIAQIGRLEHATLEGGALVPMHMHQNEEILSYLRKGAMHHKDSAGNEIAIHKKHLMLMNAGSGIHHEEGVPEGDETVEMLQIFIRPIA
ncbi:MAG: pirin family protein, partial [Balneolaceae bacterium]